MNIFRLRNWTHHEPKRAKGSPRLISRGFKAPATLHAVMLHLGNVPGDQALTIGWLKERLAAIGLHLDDEAVIEDTRVPVSQDQREGTAQ